MNYPVNTKPRLSGMAIASGVLIVLSALVSLVLNLINRNFVYRTTFFDIVFVLGLLACVVAAVLIFVRVKGAVLAIPFGFLALKYVISFISLIRSLIDYCRWFGVAEGLSIILPNVLIDILMIASFILMVVTCAGSKNRKALGITAGIIYAVNIVFSWLIYPIIDSKLFGYSLNFRYIIREILPNIVGYIPDILMAVAMILLGIALSKLAPAMQQYAPYGYAQRPPMQSGYAQNGYAPNGYAQRPMPGYIPTPVQVQNNVQPQAQNPNMGYAPVQNVGYAPVQNPVNTQAQPQAPVMQNNYQNAAPTQVLNDNPAPQAPNESVASSADEANVEKTSAPQTDTDKLASELSAYKKMLENGLISEADFEAKKKQLLGL